MMTDKDTLTRELFALSGDIRYVAVYDGDGLSMQQRSDLGNASSGESDKYEELLVNPTLLKLASQRGHIDCGGLDYLVIRYGNFFVLLVPVAGGHVNLGIEPGADPLRLVGPLMAVLETYHLKKPV